MNLEAFKQYLLRADLNPVTLVMQGVQATKVCGASLYVGGVPAGTHSVDT